MFSHGTVLIFGRGAWPARSPDGWDNRPLYLHFCSSRKFKSDLLLKNSRQEIL